MALEIHVFFRGRLPSKAALSRTLKALEFPLAIRPSGGPLERHKGLLPMRLRGEETGVEFDMFEGREVVEELGGKKITRAFDRSANLRWGGDENAMTAAFCFAAALAKAANGVVFDAEAGRTLSLDKAIGAARSALKMTRRTGPLGTRPADIKRYLKPLLQRRSDLVLVGPRLVIRPVRHVLRGALLEASDKYRFHVWCYLMPLFADDPESRGHDDYIRGNAFAVWQPHFQPLLIGSLAEFAFGPLGKIATLSDFAARSLGKSGVLLGPEEIVREQITALVLAGERDRAAEFAEQTDVPDFKAYFEQLVRNVDATCRECHAKEAETIKTLQLEHLWEPSPFPIELPVTKRTSTAEPVFDTASWPAAPPWLWQHLPTEPGDIRFAKDLLRREDDLLLPVALTLEQAKDRHRALEDYVLATRLPDGVLLIVRHNTLRDRNDPTRRHQTRPRSRYNIILRGAKEEIRVTIESAHEDAHLISIFSVEVFRRGGVGSIWLCYFHPDEGRKGIHDSRGRRKIFSERQLTKSERNLCTFPKPPFGEYMVFVDRVRSLLRAAGYDEPK